MRGKILAYDDNTGSGLISGDDGARYSFVRGALQGKRFVIAGQDVDFEIKDNTGVNIFIVKGAYSGEKSKVVAGLLALFLGMLGIHKFYLGQKTSGIIYLICGTIGWLLVVPALIVAVLSLIDGITYLTQSDEEFYRTTHELL
jgi:TM2 domain-containing membrane protein YozV